MPRKNSENYYVTYKNVLRPHKDKSDFQKWLKAYWRIQQEWGATSYDLWSSEADDRHVLFCRYTVSDLDHWTSSAVSPGSEELVKALNKIVDMNRISIKITANA